MKVLQTLVLFLGLVMFVNAQVNTKAVLSGTVYDANGAVISDVKITAVNQKGEIFDTFSNAEGNYILNLPYTKYDAKSASTFKMAKYEITFDGTKIGFYKNTLKNFNFVPSHKKMWLDFALDVKPPDNVLLIQSKTSKEKIKNNF